MARKFAGILGLLALIVSLMLGILAGGGAEAVLWTAWCRFVAFTVIGGVMGWLAERTIRESVSSRIAAELDRKPQPAATPAKAGAA